ncbi:MAG: hypothetical protein KatS3mg105_1041 [Gemmatales bacterium]|nr:MAG: hypothetical protein KatS3mg105_1041 [Gemmatales bacterium]
MPRTMPSLLFLAGSLVCLLALTPAEAHPVARRCHDRTIKVEIQAGRVIVFYHLDVDYFTIVLDELPVFVDVKTVKGDAIYSEYMRHYAPVIADNLDARIDKKKLDFKCRKSSHRLTDDEGRPLGHVRCEFTFEADWQPKAGKHTFTFREGNYVLEEGYIRMSIAAPKPLEIIRVDVAPEDLQQRPTRELGPGDDERLREASAVFLVPENAVPVLADAGHSHPHPHGSEAGHDHSWMEQLLDTNQGYLLVLILAAFFGAAHALTPGHGKTLVAAYLVGEKGTAWHALLLGIVTTLSHTGVVILIAVFLHFFYRDAKAAEIEVPLKIASGLLVAGFGFWLLTRRLAGRADHVHLGGGHHHHGHTHAHHHHDHDLGHDHPHHHDHDHKHADHYHDEHGHAHPLPANDQKLTRWGIVLLGISGGMVPCWDAITLLIYFRMTAPLLALSAVLAFSAGLASVLVAIGMAVVYLRGFAQSHFGEGKFFKSLPIISATVVMLLGLWLCYDGIQAMGQ